MDHNSRITRKGLKRPFERFIEGVLVDGIPYGPFAFARHQG